MALFPDYGIVALREKQLKPANRQTSSAGYTMSFPKGTVLKKILSISYAFLSKADKDAIETFFDTYQGESFTINDPDPNSSDVLTVIFDQDSLEFLYVRVFPGEYTLDMEVREV